MESWLASKEAFLNTADLGDSPDNVQLLIKKHDGFEQVDLAAYVTEYRNWLRISG